MRLFSVFAALLMLGAATTHAQEASFNPKLDADGEFHLSMGVKGACQVIDMGNFRMTPPTLTLFKQVAECGYRPYSLKFGATPDAMVGNLSAWAVRNPTSDNPVILQVHIFTRVRLRDAPVQGVLFAKRCTEVEVEPGIEGLFLTYACNAKSGRTYTYETLLELVEEDE